MRRHRFAARPPLAGPLGLAGWLLLAAAAEGRAQSARLDFETYPDGTTVCESCPLTDEFAARGVLFGFRSPFTSITHAQLIDSSTYDPPDTTPNHAVTAALSDQGFEVGILELTFPASPAEVSFRVRGSDAVPAFSISAFDRDGAPIPAGSIRRRVSVYENVWKARFRQETVTVASPAGVARVELDGAGPPGHILLVDELAIGSP